MLKRKSCGDIIVFIGVYTPVKIIVKRCKYGERFNARNIET